MNPLANERNQAMVKKRTLVRWYQVGINHERILLREEIRENSTPSCTKRRISELDGGGETFEPINLNELAAHLPREYEGQWIVEVVRSFGTYRGIHVDAALRDVFHEALIAAMKAVREAREKGGDRVAFLKQAVRARLINLQREADYRDARLESVENRALCRNPFGTFKSALRLLSPEALRIWYAYRCARGVVSALARELGTTDYLARTRYLPRLTSEMKMALEYIFQIRHF